jgi:sigma-B regulation protein RsbU (phosphoserine phosphatase)
MFFTIWYGVYNRKENALVYSSGGHPPALLCIKSNGSNRLIKLWNKNYVVGGFEDVTYEQDTYLLNESSSLYVFSDGVYEFMQSNGVRWKYNDFENYLSTIHFQNSNDLKNIVNPIMKLNNSNFFEDDFTILRVSFN